MDGFDRRDGRSRGLPGFDRNSHSTQDDPGGRPPVRKLSTGLVIVILAAWSLLIWGGYLLGDVLLTWLTANQSAILAAGGNAGSLLGLENETGGIASAINATGLVGQILGLLRFLLLPAAVVVWLLGAALVLAAPLVLARIGGMLRRIGS